MIYNWGHMTGTWGSHDRHMGHMICTWDSHDSLTSCGPAALLQTCKEKYEHSCVKYIMHHEFLLYWMSRFRIQRRDTLITTN